MTFDQSPFRTPGSPLGNYIEALRPKWGWFVGLGLLSAVLGIIALGLTVTATIVSVVVIGAFMIMTGVTEIVIGFQARSWGRVLYWELAGILYVLAGVFAIAEPFPASLVITLFLGAGLLATGAVRLVLGWRTHDAATRTPLILAGAVTALLGLIIVVGWPGNSLFVLGTLLGIDILFSGVSWTMFGLRLRKAG